MAQAAFTRSVMFGVLGLAFVASACGDESSSNDSVGDSPSSSERVVVETTESLVTTELSAQSTAPADTAAPTDTEGPPSDSPPDTPPTVDVSNVAEFPLGATVTYDDGSTVVVLSYTQTFEDPNSIMGPPTGIEFGVATVQICAGAEGTKFLDLGSWEAVGAAAETFRQSLFATPMLTGLIMLPIEPNVCVDGDVGFEVPAGQSPVFVLWSDPAWESVKWRIG